jgi:hypothetical protein
MTMVAAELIVNVAGSFVLIFGIHLNLGPLVHYRYHLTGRRTRVIWWRVYRYRNIGLPDRHRYCDFGRYNTHHVDTESDKSAAIRAKG